MGMKQRVEMRSRPQGTRSCRRSLCARSGARCHSAGTQRVRDAAALRVAGKIRADAGPERMLDDLLEEAVAIVGGDAATVYGWDEVPGGLVVVRNTVRTSGEYVPSAQRPLTARLKNGFPVISGQLPARTWHGGVDLARRGARAIAVPLLYEGRLLGALGVVTYSAEKHFDAADAQCSGVSGRGGRICLPSASSAPDWRVPCSPRVRRRTSWAIRWLG